MTSAFGPKQTSAFALHMSAYDTKADKEIRKAQDFKDAFAI
jgi:hypothetical protein